MLRVTCLAGAMLALASVVSSQSLYTLSPGPPGSSMVLQLAGPPGVACGYPNGPILGGFPTFVPFGCPTVGAVAPAPGGILGDVAHSQVTDVIWATDGPIVTGYTPAGVPLASFPSPIGPLTGLGMNSAAGILWMTNGPLIAAVLAPPAGCAPVPLLGPPFPSPSPGLLTDIEWDPVSGTLFGCDVAGFVTNILIGGAIGPAGIFPVVGGCAPPLIAPLSGIAVDTGTPSILGVPLTLTVTNGIVLHRVMIGGPAPSPPTFYAPLPCAPVFGGITNGLCSALHGITYGAGCNSGAGPIPTVTLTGNSTTPGAIVVTLGAAVPGSLAWMIADLGPLCPAPAFKGCPLYALPTFVFGPFPVPLAGTVSLTLGLPPALPIGAELFGQWLTNPPGPGWALSPGFEFTIGMP